ncbi:MAG: DNA polymerase IV [Negativicutes bacterium]|nr:DNA polymerase IV [Negativicutes bacterium]
MSIRTILHCDLDNFYASVESLASPELRSRPLAVCGRTELRQGIVLAKNQLAKKFAVKTGDTIWQARQKCPQLAIVPPRFGLYWQFARAARDIYLRFTDQVECFGIDESWLDVGGSRLLFGDGLVIARQIRRMVRRELGITVSVGVSFNKVFAKLGSELNKPDGIAQISPDNFRRLVWPRPVTDLLYVGRAAGNKLHRLGIDTIGRLAAAPPAVLQQLLGRWGLTLYRYAHGQDHSPVLRHDLPLAAGSVGHSLTTHRDMTSAEDVRAVLLLLADSVAFRLRRLGLSGRTVSVGLRYSDLSRTSRQTTLARPTDLAAIIAETALPLVAANGAVHRPLRSLGLQVSNLQPTPRCQPVIDMADSDRPAPDNSRHQRLAHATDRLRQRFGPQIIRPALLLGHDLTQGFPAGEHLVYPAARH